MGQFERAIDVPYTLKEAVKRFIVSRPWWLGQLLHVEHVRGLAQGPPVDAFLLRVVTPDGAKSHVEVDFVSHRRDGYNWRIVAKKPRFHDLPAGLSEFEGSVSFAEADPECRITVTVDIEGFEPDDPAVNSACDAAVEAITEQMAKHKHWR